MAKQRIAKETPSMRKPAPRLFRDNFHCLALLFSVTILLHLRLQTWFPFLLHICFNGHEWLARLHAHGLIAKVSRTHRWQVTQKGRRVMTALLAARQADTEKLISLAA
jgi:hypothetical protein